MFERNEHITKLVDQVFDAMKGRARGEIMTHGEVAKILKMRPRTGSWEHVMKKVRRRMEAEVGITVHAEYNVGYRLLTVDEQIREPIRGAGRAARIMRRSVASSDRVPDQDMDMSQRRLRAMISDAGREAEERIRADRRMLAALARPAQAMPRRILQDAEA